MNRRDFLITSLSAVTGAIAAPRSFALSSQVPAIHISLDSARLLGVIPADFVGLGYEISSVARSGLLSARNRTYTQLVRNLGESGVIRVGGNTSDYSAYTATGTSVSRSKSTVVNQANLQELATFLEATEWNLIWGLNLGSTGLDDSLAEAKAVSALCGSRLLAFEIGNEPDLFVHEGHRPSGYEYAAWLADYRRFKAAIRAALPGVQFAGPDVAVHTDWVESFASDEDHDIRLLTHHYYREGQNPSSTLDKLLRPDPKLAPQLARLAAASSRAKVPYRICEVNSFSGGGRPGVSDTFGAALWALDYMFTLVSASCAGVNMETGVNQLDFVSSYSPIVDDQPTACVAAPEYYGMLAFAQATRASRGTEAQRLALPFDPAGLNLTAYAVHTGPHTVTLTVINKESTQDASVALEPSRSIRRASVARLAAPSLTAKQGITYSGSSVTADGHWRPRTPEALPLRHRVIPVHVPAASAAVVILDM